MEKTDRKAGHGAKWTLSEVVSPEVTVTIGDF